MKGATIKWDGQVNRFPNAEFADKDVAMTIVAEFLRLSVPVTMAAPRPVDACGSRWQSSTSRWCGLLSVLFIVLKEFIIKVVVFWWIAVVNQVQAVLQVRFANRNIPVQRSLQ